MSFLRMNGNSKLVGAPEREYVGARVRGSESICAFNDTTSKIQPKFLLIHSQK